jgi:chorismate mutase
MTRMAPRIEQLRVSIDEIDQRILALLAQRLRLVLEVGEVKREQSLEVFDPDRERRLIDKLGEAAPAPLKAGMARRIFQTIVTECRSLEETRVSGIPDAADP